MALNAFKILTSAFDVKLNADTGEAFFDQTYYLYSIKFLLILVDIERDYLPTKAIRVIHYSIALCPPPLPRHSDKLPVVIRICTIIKYRLLTPAAGGKAIIAGLDKG
jgi:hypothetical protein